jgi:hypothetical protein
LPRCSTSPAPLLRAASLTPDRGVEAQAGLENLSEQDVAAALTKLAGQ